MVNIDLGLMVHAMVVLVCMYTVCSKEFGRLLAIRQSDLALRHYLRHGAARENAMCEPVAP